MECYKMKNIMHEEILSLGRFISKFKNMHPGLLVYKTDLDVCIFSVMNCY